MTPQASKPRPIAAVRLEGGRLCLNFVNTIHDRGENPVEDYIAAPQRFREWSLRAGAIDASAARRWARAARAPTSLSADVSRLRDDLHALFTAVIDGTPIPAAALRGVDLWTHRAWCNLHLDASAAGWLRPGPARSARRACHAALEVIALSALELLRAGDLVRLRRCQAPDVCGWLFYDDSRNGSRRWCSMSHCGALFKTRRYRARRRVLRHQR
jgi:predicted RNA-binding Zn ribbon-like protein